MNHRLAVVLLLVLLVVLLVPAWPYAAGFGYWPSGALFLVLVVVVVLLLLGKL